MARYLTLINNPWSKKGEIVENYLGYRWADKEAYDFPVNASDYPSIWQPIEEEEELLEPIISMDWSGDMRYLADSLAKLYIAVNSLTQRVKELEEHE